MKASHTFADFNKRIKKTPESIKRRKVRGLLRATAGPIRTKMREVAYTELKAARKKNKKVLRKASEGGRDWEAYNLAGSINIFVSKGRKRDKITAYIGLRSTNKTPSGAPYGMPFLTGRFKTPNPKWPNDPPRLDFVRKTNDETDFEKLHTSKTVARYVKREMNKVWK